MKFKIILLFLIIVISLPAEVITFIPSDRKVVFLTFDACETKTPSYFDKKILDFLIKNKIPATFFISGKFANRNRSALSEISKYDFFSIQNHSYDHNLHMETMTHGDIEMDLNKTSELIAEITGKKPNLFRFPGGNYDNRSLKLVEDLGYKVVHWSFESGDPDKKMTSDLIFEKVKKNVKSGSIMIFHINGRGWHTSEALPMIINYLNSEGYHLELLENFLKNEKFN